MALDLTIFLKLYSKFRLQQLSALKSRENVRVQQEQILKGLIATAKKTVFGCDHGFDKIQSYSDYKKQVPLRYYESFWNDYWSKSFPNCDNLTWPGLINYYAVSSGTSSGTTKYIPYTNGINRNYQKAGLDLLAHHVANCPKSRIFGGKNFVLGGSTNLVERAPGVFSGDISGISVAKLPWWAKLRYFPPAELCKLSDWEEKVEIFSTQALKEDIRMFSGVPAWMLIVLERMFKLTGVDSGRITDIFPNLNLIVHGGVNFNPYYKQFQSLLEGSSAELREVYPASEGFFAVADHGFGEGLRLLIDNGIFFEFVPFSELDSSNPTRLTLDQVEVGENYAVVLTTCAGLWSYIIGDTVSFSSVEPPRVLVTGRTSYFLSAFGEHLIAEEIDDAVSRAADKVKVSVTDYSVGVIFPKSTNELGGHMYIVETNSGNAFDRDLFIKELDEHLCKRNEDYEAHRSGGLGMLAPQVQLVPPGTFANWMKHRGKLGGQNKVPRIINKTELFEDLLGFISSQPSSTV